MPTLRGFATRFIDGHARANRQRPSGIAAKEMILRLHLVPRLGEKRLDTIANEDVQRLKRAMVAKAPKTVNNVLTVLSTLLKKAVEWNVIERMPCTIRLLPIPRSTATFHDFDAYERLITSARTIDRIAELIVLLGGEAGLRCGEMIALEWRDIDLTKRQLCIQRSDWNGQVNSPKGGRLRYVPLTRRLAAALQEHRHLRSSRVLCQDDGRRDNPAKGAVSGQAGGTEGERAEGGAFAPTHVLFAPGDARRSGSGRAGTGRAQRAGDDPALHASEPRGAGCGHSIARGPWQHVGNADRCQSRSRKCLGKTTKTWR